MISQAYMFSPVALSIRRSSWVLDLLAESQAVKPWTDHHGTISLLIGDHIFTNKARTPRIVSGDDAMTSVLGSQFGL
jgi:hypothetical protein